MSHNPRLQAAILAAASWLEANPDRHIAVHLAEDDEGRRVININKGTCFCALGRIAYELKIPEHRGYYRELERQFYPYGIPIETITERNDIDINKKAINGGQRGNPQVIPYLKKLVPSL